MREDHWEVFDAIARARDQHRSLRPSTTIVTNAEGVVIAASDPREHPVGSQFTANTISKLHPGNDELLFDPGAETATAVKTLSYPGRIAGMIHATFDTRHLAAERSNVLWTLIATNGALTALLALAGWLLVTRMMRPVRVLFGSLGVGRRVACCADTRRCRDHDTRRIRAALQVL